MSNEDEKQEVTFIETPFTNAIAEVTEAQHLTDELELDADLVPTEDSDADLERLAQAMAGEAAGLEEELKEIVEQDEKEAAERLAREIAEDEALQKQMAEEAEKAEEIDPELQAALPKEPVADENGNLDLAEMESCLETLLFMMDKPAPVAKLRELLGPEMSLNVFQEALTSLQKRYEAVSHGIELVQVAGGYQFRTKPGRAALAKKLARIQVQRLSSGAMETLAIVAYKQPVLKDEIDKIRGVDSSHFIRGLLDRKLIQISGRSELPGRPMLYSTTQDFLELFGLKELAAMPSLREIEQMVPSSQVKTGDEDPRVREMRRLVGQMNTDTSTTLAYNPKEDEQILKDIREKVSSIPTSTPYLDAQREAEKHAKLLAEQGISVPVDATPADLLALIEEAKNKEAAIAGGQESDLPQEITSQSETAEPASAEPSVLE
jgi:segregation and condensation protein B